MSIANYYQPEVLSTVNFIPPVFWGRTSLTVIVGSAFLAALLLSYLRGRRQGESFKVGSIVRLIGFFWLPLLLVFIYNQYRDFQDNWSYPADRPGKEIARLCDIDQRQGLGGLLCALNGYMSYVKKTLPEGATVRLAVAPGIENNFYYSLLDRSKFAKDADYVLMYYPQGYMVKDNAVYERSGKLAAEFASYKPVRVFSPLQAVLVKK